MRHKPNINVEGGRRRGTIALLAIICLTLLMVVLAFVVNVELMASVQVQLRGTADAAAGAAASTLVSDDLLRGDSSLMPALIAKAQQQGQIFADANPPAGLTGALQLDLQNPANSDLLFGNLDHAGATSFTSVGSLTDPSNSALLNVNAVQANPRLTSKRGNAPMLFLGPLFGQDKFELAATATVMLDRDVIGFKPITSQPLPLAPLALLEDFSGVDGRSWEYQVHQKKGEDAFTFTPTMGSFASGSDQLFEFNAVMALDNSQLATANVALLFIGQSTVPGLTQQLGTGVTSANLTDFGGSFVLDSTNRLTVPAQNVGPSAVSADLSDLVTQLSMLAASAEVRIWPLYASASGSTASVCGFVAARVVNVEPIVNGGPLRFRLQQTMLATPSAITDFTRRGINGTPIINPYLCKVRYVQ